MDAMQRQVRRMNWGVVVCALAALSACAASTQPAGGVTFETVKMTIKGKGFVVEVADTDARRQQGLMNREKMAADHGMIFVFEKEGMYTFWMKNTKIALDLVYLDAKGKVVDIVPLKPMDETSVGPRDAALYAIELNAGTCKELGLTVGDLVEVPAGVKAK